MMIKSKRIFLISSLCVGCFLLGNVFILSSCSTNSLLQMNPPSTPSQPSNPTTPPITPPVNPPSTPSQPSNPTTPPITPPVNPPSTPSQPSNPNVPSVTPPVNPPVVPPVTPPVAPNPPDVLPPQETTTINNDSLIIKGNKSHILPSMLLTEDKQNIDISKFDKKYGASITSETFKLVELDDTNGTISFEMSYQETNTKQQKTFLFSYSGLMKISSNLRINFIQSTNSFLNAYQYSKKLIDMQYNTELFLEFINLLSNENKNKFTIINGLYEIPLDYLKINSYSLSGWSNSWFTLTSKISITYNLKNPQIKFFMKSNYESNVTEKTINFTSNATKNFTVSFHSAADYVLNNISVNDEFSEEKTSDYYWGDGKFNKSIDTNLKLSTAGWLKKYNETLEGTDARYKVVLANNSDNVEVLSNKNLSVNVKIKVESNLSNLVYSTNIKKLEISNIKKIVDDPFSYDASSIKDKFSFNQKAEKLDSNLQMIKLDEQSIKDFVLNKTGQIDITALLKKSKEKINASLLSNMEISFSGTILSKNKLAKVNYYSNDNIYVERIDYNKNDFKYFYNKEQDVFQVKITPTVVLSVFYTSNNPITVNFTKPGASLTNLKK